MSNYTLQATRSIWSWLRAMLQKITKHRTEEKAAEHAELEAWIESVERAQEAFHSFGVATDATKRAFLAAGFSFRRQIANGIYSPLLTAAYRQSLAEERMGEIMRLQKRRAAFTRHKRNVKRKARCISN